MMEQKRFGGQAGPRVSLCMIVRDESKVIGRCLSSVEGAYDEICAVDTGSTDGTDQLLRDAGATVALDLSCNGPDGLIRDFSEARNRALSMATGDWVVQIDADEVMLNPPSVLRGYLTGPRDILAITLRSGAAQWSSVRVFRRAGALQYVSPVHEYIEHKGERSVAKDIIFENRPNKQGKESAQHRNIRIAENALLQDQTLGRLWHNLGNDYMRAGRFDEAIRAYSATKRLGNFEVGRFHTLYYLSLCHLISGRADDAMDAACAAIEADDRYAEGYCALGDAYYGKGEFAAAREQYDIALSRAFPPDEAILPVHAWAYSEYPRRRIKKIEEICNSKR